MKKYKLSELMEVTRGMSLCGEYYATEGDLMRLTLGNFDYRNNCFKDDKSKDNLFFSGDVKDEFILNKGDIITPLTEQAIGLLGSTAKVPCSGKYIQSQDVGLIKCNEKLHPDFAFYLIPSKLVRNQLSAAAQQTKIRHTSPDKIKSCTVWIPEYLNQEKIGRLLSSLDDKIALNRRMNAKLEQMAKHLYDHWFVQFDFLNANGKPYKASGGKMVWNEVLKREIPQGWEVKKLGDVCEIVLGGTPSTANNEFWDNGTISWLNSGEVGIFPIVESEKKITEIAVEKSTTEFLKAGSVTLSITRYLRPSILAIDACINQSVVGIKENDLFKNCFLYPYLQNEIDRLMSLRTGAQQPHINKEIVEDSFINIPPKELMEKYEKKVTPIYLQIINIAKETQKLTVLRDNLLPLLMNGQVEVE